jgi:hypothetical protein
MEALIEKLCSIKFLCVDLDEDAEEAWKYEQNNKNTSRFYLSHLEQRGYVPLFFRAEFERYNKNPSLEALHELGHWSLVAAMIQVLYGVRLYEKKKVNFMIEHTFSCSNVDLKDELRYYFDTLHNSKAA